MSGCNCTGYCHIHGHCPNGGEPFQALNPQQHEALTKQLEQVKLMKKMMDEVEERIARVHETLAEARETIPKVEKKLEEVYEEPSTNIWIHIIGAVVCLTIIALLA